MKLLLDIGNTRLKSAYAFNGQLKSLPTLAHQFWPATKILIPKAQRFSLGVTNGYQEPEKLGIDRWLALIAIRQLYSEAICVVDCGTAITVDFLAANGQHLGGVISPGLLLMKRALAWGTEQLPMVQQHGFLGLANHTEAAINSGVLYAATGLIEKCLTNQASDFKLVLSGGDAQLLASFITKPAVIHPELVLQGLLAVSHEEE